MGYAPVTNSRLKPGMTTCIKAEPGIFMMMRAFTKPGHSFTLEKARR
jgi:hypothetical protein